MIALVHAFKGGYAAATLIAVYGGSRWGWIVPQHDVDMRIFVSGTITVTGFCITALMILRGSKTFYIFGALLNFSSLGSAIARGSIGPVGLVAFALSVIALILMALPSSWTSVLKGVSSRLQPIVLVTPVLVGAAILPIIFSIGGESGAERDGLVQNVSTDSGSRSFDFDEFVEESGVDRGCLMRKLFFEFGSSKLSGWDNAAPTSDDIERILTLAEDC